MIYHFIEYVFESATAVQAEFSQGHNSTSCDENEKMLSSAYFHVLCCAVAALLSLMLAYFTSFAFGIQASYGLGAKYKLRAFYLHTLRVLNPFSYRV